MSGPRGTCRPRARRRRSRRCSPRSRRAARPRSCWPTSTCRPCRRWPGRGQQGLDGARATSARRWRASPACSGAPGDDGVFRFEPSPVEDGAGRTGRRTTTTRCATGSTPRRTRRWPGRSPRPSIRRAARCHRRGSTAGRRPCPPWRRAPGSPRPRPRVCPPARRPSTSRRSTSRRSAAGQTSPPAGPAPTGPTPTGRGTRRRPDPRRVGERGPHAAARHPAGAARRPARHARDPCARRAAGRPGSRAGQSRPEGGRRRGPRDARAPRLPVTPCRGRTRYRSTDPRGGSFRPG